MPRYVTITAFLTGFASCLVQLVLLREVAGLFGTNEQAVAFVLGAWLLSCTIGSLAFNHTPNSPKTAIPQLLCLMMLWAGIAVILLRSLRNPLFGAGTLVAPVHLFYFVLLVLAPFCLANGAVLAGLAKHKPRAANIYIFDTTGTIFGGFLFSLWAAVAWSHRTSIFVTIACLACAAWFFARYKKSRWPVHVLIIGAFVISGLCVGYGFAPALKKVYGGQQIVKNITTPQGIITQTRYHGQTGFYKNGHVLDFGNTVETAEEKAHLAGILAGQNKRFLLVGGTGTPVHGLLAHAPAAIDFIVPDFKTAQLYKSQLDILGHPSVSLIQGDAVLHFLSAKAQPLYDAIIFDLPTPENFATARFFSLEIIKKAKRLLAKNGVVTLSTATAYSAYMSPAVQSVLLSALATLHSCFNHIMIVPGRVMQIAASDADMLTAPQIKARLDQLDAKTLWAKPHGWGTWLTPAKQAETRALGVASQNAPVNRLWNLTILKNSTQAKNSIFHTMGSSFAVLLPVLVLVALFGGKAKKHTGKTALFVAVSGFCGSVGFLVALAVLQFVAAGIFRWTGAITGLYMAGLAIGAWHATNPNNKTTHPKQLCRLLLIQAALVCATAASLPVIFAQLQAGFALLLACCLFNGVFSGMVFSTAEKQLGANKAGGLVFAADFAGGTIGMLATGLWIVYSANLLVALGVVVIMTLMVAIFAKHGEP